MKLKINFALKTGVTGEVPVLAILNYGYKEYDVTKQKHVYKPLKYYTGIKVTKSGWDEVQEFPTKKAQQIELLSIEKQINDVWNALNTNDEAVTNSLTFVLIRVNYHSWQGTGQAKSDKDNFSRIRRRAAGVSPTTWCCNQHS